MAKTIKPLTATQVDRAKPLDKEYSLFDGDGLYILVRPSGSKTWMLRLKDKVEKAYKIKLGTYPEMTLVMARDKRSEFRFAASSGLNIDKMLGNSIKSSAQDGDSEKVPA